MADHGASDFGKDFGLLHEAIVTGRKVGADREFWARLAHDEKFFAGIVARHRGAVGSELPDIDWAKTYAELGMSAEYERDGMTMNLEGPGWWLVPVVKDLMPNKIVATMRRLGIKVETFGIDLDAAVTINDRDSRNGLYGVHFKKTVEADPENANLSANDCAKREVNGITLNERLLLGLGYLVTNNAHLDVKTVTLCAGSRSADGYVPCVRWSPSAREVCVRWSLPDDRRVRAAV